VRGDENSDGLEGKSGAEKKPLIGAGSEMQGQAWKGFALYWRAKISVSSKTELMPITMRGSVKPRRDPSGPGGEVGYQTEKKKILFGGGLFPERDE